MSSTQEDTSSSTFTPLVMAKPPKLIQIDYAGPFMGKMFLFIISAYSKWLDVHFITSATTVYNRLCYTTIEKLRATFAIHGLSEMIV